jgi:hypothetical protein
MAADGLTLHKAPVKVGKMVSGHLLRDAGLYEFGAGTSEIQRILVGCKIFKETS